MAEVVATYSIVACDLDAGQCGVAVQSRFLAVGSIVPWAEPEVGAVATQALAKPRYGPDGLALLRQGLSADEVVRRLTEADGGRDERQLGVISLRQLRNVHRLRLQRVGRWPRDAAMPGSRTLWSTSASTITRRRSRSCVACLPFTTS